MRRLILIFALLSSLAVAQEIRRPTTDANTPCASCSGTNLASVAQPNAYDASGDSTYSQMEVQSTTTAIKNSGRVFSAFSPASGSYSALTLKVTYSCLLVAGVGVVEYSTDGGTTYTELVNVTVNTTKTTASVTLPANQNLSLLKVRSGVEADPDSGSGTITDLDIYDIRTEGTLASGKRVTVIQ